MVDLVLRVCLIILVILFSVAVLYTVNKRKGTLRELQNAVERLHNCSASFIENVVIVEKFCDETAWSDIVSVYELKGHPQATRAYAWSSPIEGSTKRGYHAMLHIPPIDSAEKAVRASIMQDQKIARVSVLQFGTIETMTPSSSRREKQEKTEIPRLVPR